MGDRPRCFILNGSKVVTALRLLAFEDILRLANVGDSAFREIKVKKSHKTFELTHHDSVVVEEGMVVTCR